MSEQLVLHHTYALGQAFDVSEHGNHGELLGGVAPPTRSPAVCSSAPKTGTSAFPPSNTLIDLRSVRVRVRFMWVPDGDSMHVHTLVMGDQSSCSESRHSGV